MNNAETGSLSSYVDDTIGNYQIEPARATSPKNFWPWHLPRKQLVRQNQWCEEIEKLLTDDLPDANLLRYFGLPGNDFLDLRCFHDKICVPRNIRLKFLGFNLAAKPGDANNIDQNVSYDEIKRLEYIHFRSEVQWDDYRSLSREDSLATESAKRHGPFDVINLDLCDGFAKQGAGVIEDSHYTALGQLLGIQARRPKPWLLFLTTRIGGVTFIARF